MGWPFGPQDPQVSEMGRGLRLTWVFKWAPRLGERSGWGSHKVVKVETRLQWGLLLPPALILFLFLQCFKYTFWLRISGFIYSLILTASSWRTLHYNHPSKLLLNSWSEETMRSWLFVALSPWDLRWFVMQQELTNTAGNSHRPEPFTGSVLLPCHCVPFLSPFCPFVLFKDPSQEIAGHCQIPVIYPNEQFYLFKKKFKFLSHPGCV